MQNFFTYVKQEKLLLILLLIGIGIYLRLYCFADYQLGFDQVILLDNGQQILEGKPVLIGPKTGYANVFIGPLTYYFTAFCLLLVVSPYTLVLYQGLIVLCGCLLVWQMSKKYLPNELAVTVLLLWLFSPQMLIFDRQAWNPSWLSLAGALVFFPLLLVKNLGKVEYLLVFIGSLLGFQAHFSGVFLPILATIFSFSRRNFKALKFAGSSIAGFILGLIPLFVFDLRHQFMNARGLISLLTSSGYDSSLNRVLIALWQSLRISIENLGKLLFVNSHESLFLSMGVVLLAFSVWHIWHQRDQLLTKSLVWVLLIALFYGFYHGPKPEYYYLLQFPAIVLITGKFIHWLIPVNRLKMIWIFLVGYGISSALLLAKPSGPGLSTQVQVSSYLHQLAKNPGITQLVFDMSMTAKEGLQYLLRDLSFSPQGGTVHIAYPDKVPYSSTLRFGAVSIWQDPRVVGQHLSEQDYILLFPIGLKVYKESSSTQNYGQPFTYVVFLNQELIGKIYVIDDKTSQEDFEFIKTRCQDHSPCNHHWSQFIFHGQQGLMNLSQSKGFFFVAEQEKDWSEIIQQVSVF